MEAYMILISVITGFVMGRMTVTKAEPTKMRYRAIKSPVKAIKEHKQRVEEAKEIDKYMTIMENVENYDGTGAYQKDVPL